MHPNQLSLIVGRLDAILHQLRLAELRRMMDRDFDSLGHLGEGTVHALKESGLAGELGQPWTEEV